MSSRNTTKIIEDVVADGVSERKIAALIEITAYAIEKIAPTLARAADFDLSDFATAKRRGVAGFALHLTRQEGTHERWDAEFVKDSQRIRIIATIGKPNQ